MNQIHKKTLQDLEYYTVLEQVAEYAVTHLGHEACLQVSPLTNRENLLLSLEQTNEYLASFDNENRIPNHGFEPITKEIKLLSIENTYLEVHGFRKLVAISTICNDILKFLNKFKEYYPKLKTLGNDIEITKYIVTTIDTIIDKYGDIKNTASPTLLEIRK